MRLCKGLFNPTGLPVYDPKTCDCGDLSELWDFGGNCSSSLLGELHIGERRASPFSARYRALKRPYRVPRGRIWAIYLASGMPDSPSH